MLQTALHGGTGASEERGLPPLAFTGRHFSLGVRPAEHPTHTHPSGVKGLARCYRNGCSVARSLGFSSFQMGVFKTRVLGPVSFREEPGACLYVPASHSLLVRPGASSVTLECSIILALSRSQAESRGCMDICGSLGFLWVWRITGLSVPFFQN